MAGSFSIQQAVFTKLDGTSALTDLLADHAFTEDKKAIYDHVPEASASEDATAFPFVVVGETTEVEFDTDDSVGRESTLTIHSFSRYLGLKELKNIMDAIKGALHDASLSVSGESTILCFWEFTQTFLDPDGITRHGVQRIRIITTGT